MQLKSESLRNSSHTVVKQKFVSEYAKAKPANKLLKQLILPKL